MIQLIYFLFALLLIGILVLIINMGKLMDQRFKNIFKEIGDLNLKLEEWKRESSLKGNIETLEIPKPLPISQKEFSPEYYKPEIKPEIQPDYRTEPTPEPVIPIQIEPEKPVIPVPSAKISEPIIEFNTPKKPERKTFMERNPDLEKFIGENLVNKIGIAILVLAIGFFVKYAIDNNWIGPLGRVSIGFILGGILIAIAHRLRKEFHAFSSVLTGGGLAVFYFTITLAYSQFHLFSQGLSFILLILVTCFAVLLALLYDREELGVIALIGGLASPFLVTGHEANYSGLFLYLVILNAGLLVIAYNKLWRVLNASAFILTLLVFSWLSALVPIQTYHSLFLYSTVLYLLFFGINIAFNIRENRKFIGFDFSIILINTAIYFSAGLYFLNALHLENFKGFFTICLAVFNLGFSFFLFRNRKVDLNILYLLIGITLTFVSLTAPLQLHGHYITLFWSAESVLLYWLYLKSEINLLKLTSWIVWLVTLISLISSTSEVYTLHEFNLPIIFNKGFITLVFVAISNYLLHRISRLDSSSQLYGVEFPKGVFVLSALVILFISGLLELDGQFNHYKIENNLFQIYSTLYILAFVYAVVLGIKKNPTKLLWVKTLLILLTSVYYIIQFQLLYNLELILLNNRIQNWMHFSAQGLETLIFILLFYELGKDLRKYYLAKKESILVWFYIGVCLLFLSMEVYWMSLFCFYTHGPSFLIINRVFDKVVLPILWGLSSFVLMWIGFHYKEKLLRIISLSLFSLTLLKLFIFDIQNIPPAGKIIAFFLLGVLLLVVSFMYQKLKNILVNEEKN